MKYVHASLDLYWRGFRDQLEPSSRCAPSLHGALTDAGFAPGDDIVILDAKEFYRLIDGLDRTAE